MSHPPPDSRFALDPSIIQVFREEGMLPELAAIFRRTAHERVGAMREALKGGRSAELMGLAHTLKGSAGNLGAGPLAASARELEEAARLGRAAACTDALARLERELERTLAALETTLRTGASE